MPTNLQLNYKVKIFYIVNAYSYTLFIFLKKN